MISIVIVVKDDREVEKTIQSLLNLTKNIPIEILVVDASNGALNFIKEAYPTIRWIPYHNPNKKITISEQRNLGVKTSRGEYIIFLDSSCIPQPNWLDELYSPTKGQESIIAGKVIASNKNVLSTIAVPTMLNSRYVTEAPTINILIKREVFAKIGMFDENFSCGEDVDFCWRATSAGYKIYYAPKAVVSHNYGLAFTWIIRAVKYGEARVYLYRKHKKSFSYLLKNNIDVIIFPILVILLPLSIFNPFFLFVYIALFMKNIGNHPLTRLIWYVFFGIGVWKGLFFVFKEKYDKNSYTS